MTGESAREEVVKIEITPEYYVEYIEQFYSPGDADDLLRDLLAVDMTSELVEMCGKTHVTKRLSAQYGVDYAFNKRAKKAQPWTPLMLSIRQRMEAVAGPLNSALVRIYPNGEAYIGWHDDMNSPLVIASLSLGAEREFAFGVGTTKNCVELWKGRLAHGSLLLIPAKTNATLKHRLPKDTRVQEPRVNVTLRRFLE